MTIRSILQDFRKINNKHFITEFVFRYILRSALYFMCEVVKFVGCGRNVAHQEREMLTKEHYGHSIRGWTLEMHSSSQTLRAPAGGRTASHTYCDNVL